MNEITKSFYVGKSYGKENGFLRLHFIHIVRGSRVITDSTGPYDKRIVEKHTYEHFKSRFGYDVELIIRQSKIKRILSKIR